MFYIILIFGLVILSCFSSALPDDKNAGCLAYIPFVILLIATIKIITFLF